MEERTCKRCGETKPLAEFPQRSKKTVNFTRDAHRYSPCKACNANQAREWRRKHKNYQGSGRLKVVPPEDRLLMSMIRARLSEARGRTKKFDLPEMDVDDLWLYDLFKAQQGKCALLGYDMVIERKHPLCPSLDKIEPDEGYVKGNVQWVTWISNRAKGDLSTDDFYQMCQLAIDYRKVQRLSKGAA